MKAVVRMDIFSYELGVLMAMAYRKEDNGMEDSLKALLNAVDESKLDAKQLEMGIRNEMNLHQSEETVNQVMLNLMVDYFDERSSFISDAIATLQEEGGQTGTLSEHAIEVWAREVFESVTDYSEVSPGDLSFEAISHNLSEYEDLEQANIETEINRQLQAAGYVYLAEDCCWEK